jgi:hypothetical protein
LKSVWDLSQVHICVKFGRHFKIQNEETISRLKRQPGDFPPYFREENHLTFSARSSLPAREACFHARPPPDVVLFSLPDCFISFKDLEMLTKSDNLVDSRK